MFLLLLLLWLLTCVLLYLWLLLILSLVRPQLGNIHLCKVPFMCSSSFCNNCGFAQTVLALLVRVSNTLNVAEWMQHWIGSCCQMLLVTVLWYLGLYPVYSSCMLSPVIAQGLVLSQVHLSLDVVISFLLYSSWYILFHVQSALTEVRYHMGSHISAFAGKNMLK